MTVYVYSLDNQEVNNPFSTEDYGSISSASTSSEDIGLVSDENPTFNFLENDWYNITVSESLIPYGTIGTLSTSQESTTYQYISSGILFEFTTQTLTENVVFTWVGNGTVFEIGNGLERTVNAYLSSGTLRVDSTVAETVLESFTVNPIESTILYIINGSYSDLQFISNVPENTQLFNISGTSIEKDIDSYVGLETLLLSGTAKESFIKGNYNGLGTLFSLDNAKESVTYDYNESSIETGNIVDNGNIVDVFSGIPLDYGQVPEIPSPQIEDFAFIIDQVIPIAYPFGGMSLSGSAVYAPNYRLYIDGRAIVRISYSEFVSGSITLSNSALESEVESYVGLGTLTFSGTSLEAYSAQTPENTQLFNISGTSLEKDVDSYVGLGTLTFSEISLERNTESYVGSGILTLSGTSLEKNTESYVGLGTLTLSGIALEKNTESYVGLGTLTLSGIALEAYSAQTPENTQLFNISGTSLERNTESYVGLGTLFGFGNLIESITYDYNQSSSTEGALDYGLVIHTEELFDDYGSLLNGGPTVDFGEISILAPSVVGELLYPFGSINFVNGYSPQQSYPWLPEPGVGKSWSFTRTGYNGDTLLYSLSGISSNQEIANYSYLGDKVTLVISGELLHPFIDYTPHYGIEKNIGIGTTGIQISGTSLERNTESYVGLGTLTFSEISLEKDVDSYVGLGDLLLFGEALEKDVDSYIGLGTLTLSGIALEKNTESYVGLGTLTFSGTSLEAYSAQTPENTQLFNISGTSLERNTESYVGLGTLTFSEISLEKDVDSYVGLGILTFSGIALEAYSAQTPENTQLFQLNGNGSYNLNREYKTTEVPTPITLSGELLHPFIDYTPHYGIEKNIGIGTTGIQYLRGVGFAPDSEGNLRDARTYSNRYPINDKVPNTGIGTIKFDEINNTAKYSPLTPYTGTGLFDIVSGYSPQESYPWLPEPGVGKSWSFTKSNYITSGSVFVSGISSTKEINVYGYYGDDNDPGTSGTIIISQQTSPIIERHVNSYIGNVTYSLSGTSDLVESRSYEGSGSVILSGTSLEVYSAQTPENTQLFEISGTSLEVYSAQTPEIEVLYIISGSIIESKTSSYVGEGTLSLNGTARTTEIPNYPTRGTIRFLRYNTDNDYDTCDSQEFTCDNLYSADVSFVANPVENIILFEITGISSTKNVSTYSYNGSGSYNFYGSLSDIRSTYFEVGFGTIFTISTVFESESEVYNGFGNLFALSGSSQSYSIQTPDSTVLVTISGSAISSIESEYSVVGIGLFNFFGFGDTKKVAVYSQFGSGVIDISGELIYPNIIFIPSPDGFGTINIIGSSDESIAKVCDDTSGSLFSFSSGLESFAKSTYIGIGTIYIQELSASTVNNPFQISRTYVLII